MTWVWLVVVTLAALSLVACLERPQELPPLPGDTSAELPPPEDVYEVDPEICTDLAQRLCYGGPSGTQDVGQCRAGVQRCQKGEWGPCEDEILPEPERCDGLDNDCNHLVDDGLHDCNPEIYLVLGPELSGIIGERVRALLVSVDTRPLVSLSFDASFPADLHPASLVIAIGNSRITRHLIRLDEVNALAPESFIIRTGRSPSGVQMIAADGVARADYPHLSPSLGDAFAAYAVLESLGFAFLHPLDPVLPRRSHLRPRDTDRTERPRWPLRGLHLNTKHPTELADFLNGFGPQGPTDAVGWEGQRGEWHSLLEWMLANRQNHLHWALLESPDWQGFARSSSRQMRLSRLVNDAHARGIAVGIDLSLALERENAFRMVTQPGDLTSERQQIREAIDWILQSDFDYVVTETGLSERHYPTPDRSLAWMNEATTHMAAVHPGRPLYVKAHGGVGERAMGYVDPRGGGDMDIHLLSYFADPRLGVMAHPVQHYGLDDPAPTHGNASFSGMRSYIHLEAGRRSVVWAPESASWNSFDVDVPLFLPLYAERRVHDLRLLAQDEDAGRMAPMQGQIVFSSGWEWGYWLNDVVAARAAWNPHLDAANSATALGRILEEITHPFAPVQKEMSDLLVELAHAQRRLLIEGRAGGVAPPEIVAHNGQAYLQGFDSWDDASDIITNGMGLSVVQMKQPRRVGLVALRADPQAYAALAPLLAEMDTVFSELAQRLAVLDGRIEAEARKVFHDIYYAATFTALRATQLDGLYAYVNAVNIDAPQQVRLGHLARARQALDTALARLPFAEANYRVPELRVARWRKGATAYDHGYLWSVYRLYYWWRDEGKAVDAPTSPCYLNVIDPTRVFGTHLVTVASAALQGVISTNAWRDCVQAPAEEPALPPDNLRNRP